MATERLVFVLKNDAELHELLAAAKRLGAEVTARLEYGEGQAGPFPATSALPARRKYSRRQNKKAGETPTLPKNAECPACRKKFRRRKTNTTGLCRECSKRFTQNRWYAKKIGQTLTPAEWIEKKK